MKKILFFLCCTIGAAQGVVTMTFSTGTGALKVGDSGGTLTSGLSWGILIDTGSNGFSNPLNAVGVPIADQSFFSPDDIFFFGGTTTTLPFGPDAGAGAVSTVTGLDIYANAAVMEGQNFAVMWFNTGTNQGDTVTVGTQYGLISQDNSSTDLLVPADGTTNDYSTRFAGAETGITSANLSFIPEPSTGLLSLLGFGLLLRRRR